jgi:hypothetical protein
MWAGHLAAILSTGSGLVLMWRITMLTSHVLTCADVAYHYADVVYHCADVVYHCADVVYHCADVVCRCADVACPYLW